MKCNLKFNPPQGLEEHNGEPAKCENYQHYCFWHGKICRKVVK